MAVPIDNKMPNINPQIRGASETASQLKIDQKLVDKILARQGLGSLDQLTLKFGPEILSYFRMCCEQLFNLGDRMQEPLFKALSANCSSPPYEKFIERDTSKGAMYQERLPDNFLTVEKLDLAAKTGLLTRNQADALKFILGEVKTAKMQEQAFHAEGAPQGQSREQGEQQQGGQPQDQYQGEEHEEWANFSPPGSSPSSHSASYNYNVSGNTAETPGNFAGGSLRQGMRMSQTGNQGGNTGFVPPPPAPPQGSHGHGNTEQSFQMPSTVQGEQSYLDASFSPDGPFYGMFQSLFGSENWYRNLAGNALGNIQKIREAKQRILAELAGLDPTKPGDAKKLYILQQKLGDIQATERQYLDMISSAQKANNERKEYIKSILDIFFQTNSAIIRNFRQ